MRKSITTVIAAISMLLFSAPMIASEHGWITSVPMPVPDENVYEVNIQRINDKQPIDARQYRVSPGEVKVRVSVVMVPGYTPKLRIANDEISAKEFTMTVESGVTYQIGGKVNPDASDEDQRSGAFWEPIVYRATKEH